MTSAQPPELLPISQCDKILQFESSHHWPEGLPAVAINRVVLAGFGQSLVFNHRLDNSDIESVCNLVSSLYLQMSFVEAARFWQKAQNLAWLPLEPILLKWGFRLNAAWEHGAELALSLPPGFQTWMIEKKVSAQELLVLGSAQSLKLEPLLHRILSLRCSRAQGVQSLELGIELALMGHSWDELCAQDNEDADAWVLRLRTLRYPHTAKKDSESQARLQTLPWPGQTQARWIRQGDKAGLELRIFVANPSDLKKSVNSLKKIQDLLDGDPTVLWPEH